MNALVAEFCIVLIFCLWFLSAKIEDSSIAPVPLFLGYWFFSALGPFASWALSLLNMEYVDGYILVLVFCISAFMAALLIRRRRHPTIARICPRAGLSAHGRRAIRMLYSCTLPIAFAYPIMVYFQAGNAFGFVSLREIPGIISNARYTSNWDPGTLINGVNTFVFVAAALSGFMAADYSIGLKTKFWIFLGILPGVATYYLTAARTGILFPLVFWLAAYIVGATYFGRSRRFSFAKVLKGGLILMALALPVVHIGFMIRTGIYDWARSMDFWKTSISTAFGHMPVLGHWMRSSEFTTLPTFELKSLAGVTAKLGYASREQGLYTLSYAVGSDDSVSNIYTAFRPLVEDCRGLAGAGCVFFLICGAANMAWQALRRGSVSALPIVFAFNVYVLWSVITSIYIYLSTLMAVVFASMVMTTVLILDRKWKSSDIG